MKILRLLFFPVFLVLSTNLFAQNYQRTNDISVINRFGDTLYSAWAGGFHNPQFSALDLNNDGKEDMVVFDREDNTFTTFINEGEPGEIRYTFAPEYISNFSNCDCFGWALLRDFNCDGRADVFCGTESSLLNIFKNVAYGDSTGFVTSIRGAKTTYNGALRFLFADKVDFPAIEDVDFDGDMDYITFGALSNYIELHQNMAMEKFGRCDTFVLERSSFCWGHFYESEFDNTAFLDDTIYCELGDFDPSIINPSGEGYISNRHAGSTLLMLDIDADGRNDLILGDKTYSSVYAVYNGGTKDYAYIDSVESFFPQTGFSVDVFEFPASFHMDVDNDNMKDLIFAPNTLVCDDISGTLMYINEGGNNGLDLGAPVEGFLQNEMIEIGMEAHPVFLDYDADGDQDLLLGNRSALFYEPSGPVILPLSQVFQNTGSDANPRYRLKKDDALLLRSNFADLLGGSPTAGDLDGDGDDDVILGGEPGELIYFKNVTIPGTTNPLFFPDTLATLENIDVGNYSAPHLYDIDGDDDLDLFIGDRRGYIAFYRNNGGPNAAQFDSVSHEWGRIKIDDEFGGVFSNGFSKPYFFDYDADGEIELCIGSVRGVVEVYENVAAVLNEEPGAQLQYAQDLFKGTYGLYAAPSFMNLGADSAMVMIGTRRGGLFLFKGSGSMKVDNIPTNIPVADIREDLKVFPNPSRGEVHISLPKEFLSPNGTSISLLNIVGEEVAQIQIKGLETDWDISAYPQGLYYVKVSQGDSYLIKKLLLQQ